MLSTVILAMTSACSSGDDRAHPYSTQTAAIGESLSVLGWNIGVSNLRWDSDSVLVDVDAAPSQAGGAHAKPEDVRFGLYGALAHPMESAGLGSCDDAMTKVHDAFPTKGTYWTEGGPDITSPDYATDWAKWSHTFTGILRNWARCIVGWNLVLDEKGRPNRPCGRQSSTARVMA